MKPVTIPKARTGDGRKSNFFLCTVTIYYEREAAMRERTLNQLLDVPRDVITKADLGRIQQGALQRVTDEMGVTSDMVRDIVVRNIVHLGIMKPEVFLGSENKTSVQNSVQ